MLDVVEFFGSLLQELAAALGLCKGRLLSMSGGSCGGPKEADLDVSVPSVIVDERLQ